MPLGVIWRRLKHEGREGHEEKEEEERDWNHGIHGKTRNEEEWEGLEQSSYREHGGERFFQFSIRQQGNRECPSLARFIERMELFLVP